MSIEKVNKPCLPLRDILQVMALVVSFSLYQFGLLTMDFKRFSGAPFKNRYAQL